jgi:hypothetical protein
MLLASQNMNINIKLQMKNSCGTHGDRQKSRIKYCNRTGIPNSWDAK